MTRIYLVRHGETDWNATQRCQGIADIPLNHTGLTQAAALGHAFRDIEFHAAYTSPLQRARRTAETILNGRQLQAVAVGELSEMSYGDWQGLAPHEWPDGASARWANAPWQMAFPGGESLDQVRLRIGPAMEQIIRSHRGETVLVSGHGHANRVILLHATGRDLTSFWDIAQPNGGAWLLEYDGETSTPSVGQLPVNRPIGADADSR
ncbi:MAG: histidine phosphatase family protein [bacterium]